jgi:hypothetical protein
MRAIGVTVDYTGGTAAAACASASAGASPWLDQIGRYQRQCLISYIYNMKTIAITIDEETLARIARISGPGESALNRSKLIRAAVKDYVLRLERAEEEEREAAIVRRHRARLARQASAAVKTQAMP